MVLRPIRCFLLFYVIPTSSIPFQDSILQEEVFIRVGEFRYAWQVPVLFLMKLKRSMAHRFHNEKLAEYAQPAAFLRFYVVGLLLFIFPFTRGFFISIIPFSLLLVFGITFYLHTEWNLKTILCFSFVVISSFFLEMGGVATGAIFGLYEYERGLGWQINGTPVIIGFNWLFLIYASHCVACRFLKRPWEIIVTGSLLMILYDVILEWIAPVMEMWRFRDGYPPINNFAAWFGFSMIYHILFRLFHIRAVNRVAELLFIIQMLFFICIGVYSLLFL